MKGSYLYFTNMSIITGVYSSNTKDRVSCLSQLCYYLIFVSQFPISVS